MDPVAKSNDDLNAANFRAAIESFRDIEPMWRGQIEAALHCPIELKLDYDSLGGRYDRMQAFIHNAVSGAIQALSQIGFDPTCPALRFPSISHVVIQAAHGNEPCSISLDDQRLTLRVPLDVSATVATEQIARRLRAWQSLPDRTNLPEPPATNPDRTAPSTPSLSASPPDRYARATQLAAALEAALWELRLWPATPRPEPLVIKTAFGADEMPFTHWLAWVLLPRLREIVAERGEFPSGSMLAPYAVRELSGCPGESELHEILWQIDRLAADHNR